MATTAEHLRHEDDLLRSYLRALARSKEPREALDLGRQHRTCPNCGRLAIFHLEAGGGWARCGACGRLA